MLQCVCFFLFWICLLLCSLCVQHLFICGYTFFSFFSFSLSTVASNVIAIVIRNQTDKIRCHFCSFYMTCVAVFSLRFCLFFKCFSFRLLVFRFWIHKCVCIWLSKSTKRKCHCKRFAWRCAYSLSFFVRCGNCFVLLLLFLIWSTQRHLFNENDIKLGDKKRNITLCRRRRRFFLLSSFHNFFFFFWRFSFILRWNFLWKQRFRLCASVRLNSICLGIEIRWQLKPYGFCGIMQ